MISLITIVIILACVVLGFFVLIQNPKGGGLTGSFGTMSSQVMGVKQSTDVMEKGTWSAMGIIAALCVITIMFFAKPQGMPGAGSNGRQQRQSRKGAPAARQQPANGAAPKAK